MKIRRLNLANFRGFEQIDLTFEPDVTLIAGVNGVGKSGILQAVAVLFSRALPEFTPSATKPISLTDEDIQHEKPALEVSGSFTVADQRCFASLQRVREGEGGDAWNRFWLSEHEAAAQPPTFAAMLAARTLTGELEAGRAATERMLHDLKQRPEQPVAIYFSPRRQLPGRPKTLPKPAPFEPKTAYPFALEDRDVTLREFMHWFHSLERLTGPLAARRKRVLDALRAVVTEFVPEFRNLRVEERPSLRFVVEKNGTPLALNQLSDGERGLLAILFDITRRLAIANPESNDPIGTGAAVILIDEIELHLHPRWQRQALRQFRKVFKNCQFVATTHSPQAIGEMPAKSVRLLERDAVGKVIGWTPDHALGMDVNRVLEELMDASAQNEEQKADVSAAAGAIDAENFTAAREILNRIEARVGDGDTDVLRLRALIAFLEGKK